MTLEASFAGIRSEPVHCYSPEDPGEAPRPPSYVLVSDLWPGNKGANQAEIVFGPGVQLEGVQSDSSADHVGDISELVNRMDIDPASERGVPAPAAAGATPIGREVPAPADPTAPLQPALGQDSYNDGAEGLRDVEQPATELYSGLFCDL